MMGKECFGTFWALVVQIDANRIKLVNRGAEAAMPEAMNALSQAIKGLKELGQKNCPDTRMMAGIEAPIEIELATERPLGPDDDPAIIWQSQDPEEIEEIVLRVRRAIDFLAINYGGVTEGFPRNLGEVSSAFFCQE